MTEQSEPYHGEIVHTQEVRGSSPFAPTKNKRTSERMSVLFLRARDVVRRFPFSLCETAVVQTAEGNSTEFVFDELRPSRPPT